MKIVTHNARFHADDVFAVAALLLAYPEAQIVRSRDEAEMAAADIVVDVGSAYDPAKKRFDHHQTDGAGTHADGVPYASFGLIWKEYGEQLAGGKEEALIVEKKLVEPIDAADNGFAIATPTIEGVNEYQFDDACRSFALDRSEAELDDLFMTTVRFVQLVLRNEIAKAALRVASRGEVLETYNQATDKRLIVLDTAMPWQETLLDKPEPLYVVFKVAEDKWYIQGVPAALGSYAVRKPFPKAWSGANSESLPSITGVADASFAHRAGHLAVAKTKEGALKLAEIALNS